MLFKSVQSVLNMVGTAIVDILDPDSDISKSY